MSIRVKEDHPAETRSRKLSVGGAAAPVRVQTILLSTAQTKTIRQRIEEIAAKLPDGEVVAPAELARALGCDIKRVTEGISGSGFFVSVLITPTARARCLCNPATARRHAA